MVDLTTRVGKFLSRLAVSPEVHARIQSVRNERGVQTRASARFERSLRQALPCLAALGAAYALGNAAPAPAVTFAAANGVESVTLQAKDLMRNLAGSLQGHLADMQKAKDAVRTQSVNDIYDCMAQSMGAQTPGDLPVSVQHTVYRQAAATQGEIGQWLSAGHEGQMKMAVSAYCQNPAHWRELVAQWQARRDAVSTQYQQAVDAGAPREASFFQSALKVFDKYLDGHVKDAVARELSLLDFAQTLTQSPQEGPLANLAPSEHDGATGHEDVQLPARSFEGARAIPVSGSAYQWAGAAVSVLGGIAQAFGRSSHAGQMGYGASNMLQSGARFTQSASIVAGTHDRVYQVEQFGRVIGEYGSSARQAIERESTVVRPRY